MCRFLFLSTMLLICYVRSILVSPGEIPDTKECSLHSSKNSWLRSWLLSWILYISAGKH